MGRGRGRKRQRWGERISPRGSFSAADAAAGEETQNAHFANGGGGENIVSSARGETTQVSTIFVLFICYLLFTSRLPPAQICF